MEEVVSVSKWHHFPSLGAGTRNSKSFCCRFVFGEINDLAALGDTHKEISKNRKLLVLWVVPSKRLVWMSTSHEIAFKLPEDIRGCGKGPSSQTSQKFISTNPGQSPTAMLITVTKSELIHSVWLDQANFIREEIGKTQIFLNLCAPSRIPQTFLISCKSMPD